MKKFFAVALAVAMIVIGCVTAFAAEREEWEQCYPDPSLVQGGETVKIYTGDFYWKNNKKDAEKDDYWALGGELYKEDFGQPTWNPKKGKSYVEKVYFEDGDDYVTMIIKKGIKTSTDQEITGTIKLRDKAAGRTYTCTLAPGDLTVGITDQKSEMYVDGDRKFSLPYDYQESKVKFSTEDGDDYGTFTADFDNDYGTHIAKYVVKIVDQGSLFLGFNETENTTLTNKYSTAKMRFINWDARPTFELEGKLSIYMKPNEYIYGIKDDNSLYRLGGSYDSDNNAYVIKTKTLGSYVVSSKALMDHTTSKPLDPAAVNNPTPVISSTPAPSSTTPPPAPSSPSSVPEPEPSSSEPAPEPEPDPEPDPEPEPDPKPESKPADSKKDDDDDDDKEKGGFPIVPVLIVVLIIVIVVCGVVIMGNKGSGSSRGRSSSRRKRFDDWDD